MAAWGASCGYRGDMTEMPPSDPATPRSDAPAPEGEPASTKPTSSPGEPGKDPLRSSWTARAWAAVVALGVVLVLLIIFIAQNTRSTTVSFLGWEGRTSLAVALLIATVAGLFLATVAGTLRILQLRRRVRREHKRRS